VGSRDESGNDAGMGLIQMFSSLISQPISNELLVYATFATGKGGRAARDLALVNVTTSFLSGSSDYGFSNLNTTQQQNLFYLLAATKTGARIGDAFKRIFRSVDHSLRKVTSSIDHILKSINKGVSDAFRVMAKGADGGARWLASGGSYSRNNGNDLDNLYSQFGIDTRGFFMSIERSDLGRAVTKLNQEPCISFAAGVAFGLSPAGKMMSVLAIAKFGAKAYNYYSISNGAASASSCFSSMNWGVGMSVSQY